MRKSFGFSLLETLVALAILGLALTSSIALIVQYHAMDLRVSAHQQAQRCLEAQYEAIRGGQAVPKLEGRHPLVPTCQALLPIRSYEIAVVVEAKEPPGLYQLDLEAKYLVGTETYSRHLEMMLWRPP